MKKFQISSVKALAFSASVIAFAVATPAMAQDAEPGEDCLVDGTNGVVDENGVCVPEGDGPSGVDATSSEQVNIATGAEGERVPVGGGITVTGSRIVRDTYTSISPIQVLNTEASQDVGLFDPSQILQRDEAASGTQIDATFGGFVLDNGPGSQTLNLRGLGADRTLLLVNGRRLAPSGVEGAPSAPSINLLPSSLIDRYDLLLDGASSVYGSDAVAGVGNIILRKDFDGLELFARGEINPQGSGEDYTVSAAWGANSDRGFIGVGIEYDHRDEIRLSDRDFFRGCNTHLEEDAAGNIYRLGVADNAYVQQDSGGTISVSESECKIGGISGRIINPYTFFGSIYYQPGMGNVPGLPDYSESTNAFGQPLDTNGDGIRDVDFQDVNTNGTYDNVFLQKQDLLNVMAYGEYTFPGDGNITAFFEAGYSRADVEGTDLFAAQLFPYVPDTNPYNPCNFSTNPNGTDCRIADNNLIGLPLWGPSGIFGPAGFDLPVRPVTAIRGDRNNVDVKQEQYRGVLGLRGDIPAFGSSWTFEVSGVYSRAEGSSVRTGIREDKLAFALGIDPTADFDGDGVFDNDGDGVADDYISGVPFMPTLAAPCDSGSLANPGAALSDLTSGCVPVNLFAGSVLSGPFGDFATQAERDYVFGTRSFDTTYEQMVLSGFVTGDLFDLPAGPVSAVFGGEWRKDRIDSQPNIIASQGLFWGFFSDKGAKGSKVIREIYGELDIPLIADKPMVRELNLNLAGRITDEEFYGTNYTYSAKAGWRPVDSLLLRMTYGTSFRAPNLRENFLAGQSGFTGIFDPCAVPDAAFDPLGVGYDASQDQRDPVILENCLREGRDPTRVGIDGAGSNTIQISSTEVTGGGSLDINPETSRSITGGFSFEETFGDGWDVSLGATYFDIKLKDSIIEPSSQFIVNDCFTRDDGQRSPFCDRISYQTDPGSRLLVSGVFSGFINLNQESVRGIDFNANFGKEVSLFGKLVDLGINVRANHLIERSTLFVNDDGNVSYDDDAGEFTLPKWTGRTTFTADIDNLRLTYQIRYTSSVSQDPSGRDEFSDAWGYNEAGEFTGFFSDTCLGAGSRDSAGNLDGIVAGDGNYCRNVGYAKEQFLHTASVRYTADRWTLLVGVDNIFNTAPPRVDSAEVFAVNNTALGAGYDYDGREFFASVSYEF